MINYHYLNLNATLVMLTHNIKFMTVKEHYDNHLGNFYSWMSGNLEEKQNDFQKFLSNNNIAPFSSNITIDLGSGHGIQSIPLANLGFNVLAIDFNQQLLSELRENAKHLQIQAIDEDIRFVKKYKKLNPELIVCFGDTIAHLDSQSDIEHFFNDIYETLMTNGKFILSFRDYATELTDESRFIPVKSDSNKILICFLEYFPERVKVTDILYTRINENWKQEVSSYYKVRVTNDYIKSCIETSGFKIIFKETVNRMITLIVKKE